MRGSDVIYEFIKRFEGLELQAYQCSAGVWTIGYGHTETAKQGQRIDLNEAERLFKNDIRNFEVALNKVLKGVEVKQCEFDALLSLSYNAGISSTSRIISEMKKGALFDKLIAVEETKNKRQYDFHIKEGFNDITFSAYLFCNWISSGGKSLQGLYNRRLSESFIFLNMY